MADVMAVTVRPGNRADLPHVLALYAQPDLDDGRVLPLRQAEAILARFAIYPSYKLYVAEQDGVIVGTFALLMMENLGHLGAPSAVVEDVAVAPEQQGRGVGRRMMEHAIELARASRCYKLSLSSNMKRSAAHAFYESLGFEKHGFSFRVQFDRPVP